MKWLAASLLCLLPTVASAAQSSMICKTNDSNEYIDIVSKGKATNDVLVQLNGGTFYDGNSMLMGDLLIITVSFDEGGMILTFDPKGKSNLMISLKDQKQYHELTCRFR